MSSFFGGGARARADRGAREGDQRFRQHIARDINDERALAAGDRPTIRRSRSPWTWIAVAVLVMAVLAFVSGRAGGDLAIPPDCQTAAIAVSSSKVPAGATLRYRITGPDDVRYVVTLDGEPVRGSAQGAVEYTNTPAGPALQLQQCLSPTLLVAMPGAEGPHELAVSAVQDDGSARQVTAVTVTTTP